MSRRLGYKQGEVASVAARQPGHYPKVCQSARGQSIVASAVPVSDNSGLSARYVLQSYSMALAPSPATDIVQLG